MDAFQTRGRRLAQLALSQARLKITGFQSPAEDHAQLPLSIDEAIGWGSISVDCGRPLPTQSCRCRRKAGGQKRTPSKAYSDRKPALSLSSNVNENRGL